MTSAAAAPPPPPPSASHVVLLLVKKYPKYKIVNMDRLDCESPDPGSTAPPFRSLSYCRACSRRLRLQREPGRDQVLP
jgi:hypothetical protein